MDNKRLYIERISEKYPDLSIGTVVLDSNRENNEILVVNGDTIFRFPKHHKAVDRLEVETAILTGIQDHISEVRVPNPVYVSLDGGVGCAFMGYRLIAGEAATEDEFRTFSGGGTPLDLAAQLARFLRELHHVPVAEAIDIQLPTYDGYSMWAEMYSSIRENLFPYMRVDAREWTSEHFEAYLNDSRNFEYEAVLKHGDVGPDNMVFDKGSWTINGIIDFGSAGLGDPAVDVAWLQYQSGAGPSFLKRLHGAYPEIESALDRARFYQGTFALQGALFGIEHDDDEAFRRGIASYI